jgi:DNA-binding NtrC family response regulator
MDDRADAGAADLFVAFRCEQPLVPPTRHDLSAVDEVLIGRGDEPGVTREVEGGTRRLSIRLADTRTSTRHARLTRGAAGWRLGDDGSKNGTVLNGAMARDERLADRDLIELGRTMLLFRVGHREGLPAGGRPDVAADELSPAAPLLTTFSRALAAELEGLRRLARKPLSLVLLGPTGAGKEVVARAIHGLSGRAGPFVAVNCGSLPAALVESELFGYKKGAFSGALEDRAGLLRSADGGTLLLDEIGDLPAAAQATLLRVLQEHEVRPVGGTRPVPVDLRVIAATHRDLESMARAGSFREDLLARLSGHLVRLPPLADRVEDLGILVAGLLPRPAPAFTPRAARALFAHHWPQNVRELEQCLAAAVGLAEGKTVDLEHLPEAVREAKVGRRARAVVVTDAEDEAQRELLVRLLREHRGNVAMVARALGKARMQIHRWVKRYGLSLESFRS